MDNIVTVFAEMRAAKGKGDRLATLLVEQAAAIREQEPGCLLYRPHRCVRDPDLFMLYEMYVDDTAFDAHLNSSHLADFRRRRADQGLIDGSPKGNAYKPLID